MVTMLTKNGSILLWVAAVAAASALGATKELVYVPGVSTVVQFGFPRSGTTAQWALLCFMAKMKNFAAGAKEPGCTLISKEERLKETLRPNRIYKTHSFEQVEAVIRRVENSSVLLFEALPREAEDRVKLLALSEGRDVQYFQSFETMQTCPLDTVRDYRRAFNLSDAEEMRARAYFRYWDVHRLCCGTQAAVAQRLRLHGCPPVFPWYDDRASNCEMFDLAVVEARLEAALNFSSDFDYADVTTETGPSRCDLQNDEVRAGAEFSGDNFTDCPSLAHKWVHDPDVLFAYNCRHFGGPCDTHVLDEEA